MSFTIRWAQYSVLIQTSLNTDIVIVSAFADYKTLIHLDYPVIPRQYVS